MSNIIEFPKSPELVNEQTVLILHNGMENFAVAGLGDTEWLMRFIYDNLDEINRSPWSISLSISLDNSKDEWESVPMDILHFDESSYVEETNNQVDN